MKLGRYDFVYARRVSHKAQNLKSPILVQFRDMVIKHQVMMAFVIAKGVTTRALGYQTDNPITVSDNLTPHNSAIKKFAVELKKQGKVDKVHVRNGLVYVLLAGERHEIKDKSQLVALAAASRG